MFACLHAPEALPSLTEALVEIASRFSPTVEQNGPATVVFSVEGLGKLIGTPYQVAGEISRQGTERGIRANLAIAANPDAAMHAARHFPGVTVIPAGREAHMLSEIPLEQLGMPAEMLDTLQRWGIRTFSEFAELPPLGIVERFGMEGLHLQDTARGSIRRPLLLSRETVEFQGRTEFDNALEDLQSLLFVANGILTDQCREMDRHGVAARELRLLLELDRIPPREWVLAFPIPLREPGPMLKLLQLQLEAHPPEAGILAILLRLIPVEPRRAQSGLFTPAVPEPARLQITLTRIGGIVGRENVGSAELLDTYRPDAFLVRPFVAGRHLQTNETEPRRLAGEPASLALRIFRPPIHARVTAEKGVPRRVAAEGIAGHVTSYAGPWRGSGEWWSGLAWERDEWDISLSDGGLYRIFQLVAGWYVAGVYD